MLNKKELTKLVNTTIQIMNLTDKDLEKGREFAVGFIVSDIYKQQALIKYLKRPCKITHGKKELEIKLINKFRRNYVRIELNG